MYLKVHCVHHPVPILSTLAAIFTLHGPSYCRSVPRTQLVVLIYSWITHIIFKALGPFEYLLNSITDLNVIHIDRVACLSEPSVCSLTNPAVVQTILVLGHLGWVTGRIVLVTLLIRFYTGFVSDFESGQR